MQMEQTGQMSAQMGQIPMQMEQIPAPMEQTGQIPTQMGQMPLQMQQMSPELANGHASWENSAALPSPQPQEPMPNWNGGNWISSSEAKGPRGRGRILFGSDE